MGLTDAVPARAVVLTDSRLSPIKLGSLTIEFRHAAPSRLYWSGHPAMRVVQALYWLRDMLASDDGLILKRLTAILNDPVHGQAIRDDLRNGLPTLPEWMQAIVRDLLRQVNGSDQHRHHHDDPYPKDKTPSPSAKHHATTVPSRLPTPTNRSRRSFSEAARTGVKPFDHEFPLGL